MRSNYSSSTLLLFLAQYLWPPCSIQRYYLLVTMIYSVIVIMLHTIAPIILRTILLDFEHAPVSRSYVYIKLIIYGLTVCITHLKIEQMLILKPLQYGMHTFSQDLIFNYYQGGPNRKSIGIFLNGLKLAQRGFNDFFWDLIFYFLPLCIQAIITIAILGSTYGVFYVSILGLVVIGYIYVCINSARWTIPTRKAYNHQDSLMLSFLASTTHETPLLHTGVVDMLQERYKKALLKDFRDFYAHSLLWLIVASGFIILTIAAGHGVLCGTLTLADFITIKSYTVQIAFPLLRFGNTWQSMQKSITNIEHILEL